MRDVGSGPISNEAILAAQRAEAERQRQAAAEAARKAQAAAEAKQKQLEAALKKTQQAQDKNDATARKDEMSAKARAMMGDLPWAAEDKAAAAAVTADFPKVTADDLKADPALGKRLAELAKDPNPAIQTYVKDTTRGIMEESLQRNLKEHPGQAALDSFKGEVADLSAKTGLGSVMQQVSGEALHNVAKDMLFEGVDAKEVAANPALGKVLATLNTDSDPAVQDKLKETVRGWTNAALDKRLEGKEGKDGVNDAMDGFRDDLRKLAQDTGMGDTLSKAAQETLDGNKDKMKDIAEKGMSRWDKIKGAVGDFLGGALDLGGDVIKGIGDFAGDAVHDVTSAVSDGIKQGSDLAGELANTAIDAAGHGAHALADAGAKGLDAAGFHDAADNTRELGATVDLAADKAGDVTQQVAHVQGQITGGAVGIAGDVASSLAHGAGNLANTGLDVAGSVIADGPEGAAAQLADKAIGPEKAEYMGQVDGYTGIITNRLGKNDSVFMKIEVGAEVGIGASAGASVGGTGAIAKNEAFVGAKLSGAAQLGRDNDGNITLSLEVGGGAEAGVQSTAEAKAGGVGGEVEAKAALAAEGRGKITMKFDPENPADVARLKALIEPTPAKIVAAAGNPLAAAAITGPALADAIAHNEVSREIGGNAGVKVGAKASAGVGPVAAEIGVGAEAVVGGSQKFNKDGTTETTIFMRAGAKASAMVAAGKVSAEAAAAANAVVAVTVKKDASGNIIGISGEEGGNTATSTNAGARASGPSRAAGRVGSNENTTQTTKKELTPEGLAEAKRRMAAGESALSAFRDLNDDPGMHRDTTFTTETDSTTLGVKFDVALGVRVKVNASATLGKSHTEVEGDSPGSSTIHTDLSRAIAGAK